MRTRISKYYTKHEIRDMLRKGEFKSIDVSFEFIDFKTPPTLKGDYFGGVIGKIKKVVELFKKHFKL